MLQKGRKYAKNSTTPVFYYIISKILNNLRFFIRSFSEKFISPHKFDARLGSLGKSLPSQVINALFFPVSYDYVYSDLFTTETSFRKSFSIYIFFKVLINVECPPRRRLNIISPIPPTISTNNRTSTLDEINTALHIGGIEPNPGPDIDSLEVISINCNGLTSDVRLLQAIGKIKKRIKTKHAIIFMQETHNTNIALLESIWKGSVNISMGTGGSRGFITFCTLDIVTVAFKADSEGRYVFTNTKIGDNKYLFSANLYSPNDHKASKMFFSNAIDEWENFYQEQSNILPPNHHGLFAVAGDLNCVLQEFDMQNRIWTCKEKDLAESIVTRMEQCGLYDSVLRSNNGNNYTWCRDKTFSKIDHIFVCENILRSITKYDTIWDLVKSDHAAISINANFHTEARRGKSYPKLNASDISSKYNKEELRKEIAENIRGFPSHWNPHQKLDYIKMVIRTKTLELRNKDKIDDSLLSQLRANLEYLKTLTNLNDNEVDLFNNLRSMVYEEEEKQAEKLKIMAGVKWREEGEKSSKYFLNAVTAKQVSSTLDYLTTNQGTISDIE